MAFLDIRKFYEIQLSIDQVLLEPSHAYSFITVFGCFCVITAELRHCDRALRACKAENIYSLGLYRQSL